jgi:hypothetical protein
LKTERLAAFWMVKLLLLGRVKPRSQATSPRSTTLQQATGLRWRKQEPPFLALYDAIEIVELVEVQAASIIAGAHPKI